MPTISCPVSITCGDQSEADPPIINFSAEAPDVIRFGAMGFPTNNPNNPVAPTTDPRDPTFDPLWAALGCVSVCYSSISLADAQQCARNQALQCVNGKNPNGNPLFFNQTAQCGFTCPDGTVYTWTVNAGYFEATTQVEANTLAVNYACLQAAINHICLGGLETHGCVNSLYDSHFQVLGGFTPFTFDLVSGSFPPGLSPFSGPDKRTMRLAGTPSQAGDFSFTLRATDARGNFMQKAFTIHILGISNANALPHAMEGRAYSQQLNGSGGTSPFTYLVISGSLGSNLTVSSSGLITGTPDYVTSGAHSALIRIRDSDGNSCTQNVTITTDVAPGPNWDALVWNFPNNVNGSGSGVGRTAIAQCTSNGVAPFGFVTQVTAAGVTYTGPAVNARIKITVTYAGTAGQNDITCNLRKAGGVITGYGGPRASGSFNFDFSTGVGAGEAWTVDDAGPANDFVGMFGIGNSGSCSITWQIFNL